MNVLIRQTFQTRIRTSHTAVYLQLMLKHLVKLYSENVKDHILKEFNRLRELEDYSRPSQLMRRLDE